MGAKVTPWVLVIGACLVVHVACSSSNDPAAPDYSESCATLASRCHGVGTALASECHELGHSGDTSKCGPRLQECLAACPEKEGGTSLPFDDAGPTDAGAADGDAGPDPTCVAYCACMKDHCSSVSNYPFSDESVCYHACATYPASDRACYTSFCEDRKSVV